MPVVSEEMFQEALDKVIESSSDGYITLAKLKKASLLIEQNNIKKGLE